MEYKALGGAEQAQIVRDVLHDLEVKHFLAGLLAQMHARPTTTADAERYQHEQEKHAAAIDLLYEGYGGFLEGPEPGH